MFRNQYDNDVTVWSPQGRIHQVEYAMEAVKQGSATIGLKSKTHAVIVALKRASSELSAYQKKIIPIDSHMGMTIAGLTADARFLSRYMRSESLNHRFNYDEPLPVSKLITMLGNKLQVCTQSYDRRPFGVGLLVAGYDDKGPHIYQTCPSANFFDCKAMAIGARSQSARTYLEKHLNEFPECSNEDLVRHGLRALRDTLPNEVELTSKVNYISYFPPKPLPSFALSWPIRMFRLELSAKAWTSLFSIMKTSNLSWLGWRVKSVAEDDHFHHLLIKI